METSCAPSLANLVMGKLEKIILDDYHLKTVICHRFIDDIFLIWTCGEDEFNRFVEQANEVHHTIEFTCH